MLYIIRARQSVLIKNEERGSCVVVDEAILYYMSASVVYMSATIVNQRNRF